MSSCDIKEEDIITMLSRAQMYDIVAPNYTLKKRDIAEYVAVNIKYS